MANENTTEKRSILKEPYPRNLLLAVRGTWEQESPTELTTDVLAGIQYAISTLNEREQLVICRRYKERKKLREIGEEIGVQQERSRQIEIAALRKLRSRRNMSFMTKGVDGYIKERCKVEYERGYQVGYSTGYAFARRKGGKIKGIISYEHWDAHIYITLPFFEFVHKDEKELLNDLETKAHSLTFTVTDDGKIQLSVMINYFDEIGDKDAVFSQAIDGNDELIEAITANIEQRKQKIIEHPLMGKIIETAAHNLGITAKEYLDRVFEDDSDPELQMQFIAALLENKDDTFKEE